MKRKNINRHNIKFHLSEAREALEKIVKDIDHYNKYNIEVAFQHLYHHLNWAWNGRHRKQNKELTDQEFADNSKYPKDLVPHGAEYSAQQGDAPEPATNVSSASQPSFPPAR